MNTTATTLESREPRWSLHLGVYAWILVASWTACMAGSLWWNLDRERREITEETLASAEISIVQDLQHRKWAAEESAASMTARGGTGATLGQPFHPSEVLPLPVLPPQPAEPSFMKREVLALPAVGHSVRSRLVSLKPIRPENEPDPWEAQGLRAFEQGTLEVYRMEGSGRGAHLRLMRPFLTEKACLGCHQAQGYKEGDIQGAISISVPMAPFWAIGRSHQENIALAHLLLWIVGLAGIGVGVARLRKQIAERRRAEEALGDSQSRLHALVQAIPDPVWLKDPNGVYLACNMIFEHFSGSREADILGKTDYDFVDRELADLFREHDRKAMEAGGPTSNEEWITFADDGHRALLDTIKTPVYDSQGKLIGVLGIGRDITERKQAAEDLRRSEQRYRSILENMEEGYYEVDLEGNLTFANDAFFRILGRTKEEMLGTNYREVMRPEKAEETRLAFNEVFRTGEPVRATGWEMIHKDGSPRAIEASVIPLRVAERRYSGFRGVIRDVTERKRAEEELRASQERYRTLVENVGEGISVVDPEETVVFSNPSADNLFGVAPGALVGRNLREFMTPDQFALIGDQTQQRQLGKTSAYEVEIVLPDGVQRNLLVTAVPQYDGAQKVSGTLAILHDITARKEAEKRLRLADQEREKAKGNALLAQLIQGLAHEIRNPLFAINVNVAVLEKKTVVAPGAAEPLGFVKEHVGRLDSLMLDLLELGRQPAARDRVDCNVRDAAKGAVADVETRTPGTSGRIFVEAPQRPFTVQALPDRLQKALVLLIENALQNSPAGSRVTVLVGVANGQAFVKVMDAGSGIREKIRDCLFEPFITTHTGRRGLGLALAKHFVESMGGTIEAANNEPGPGATFTVRFPVGGEQGNEHPMTDGR